MVSLGVVSLILIWILTCTRAVKINSTGSIYQAYTSPSQLWVTTGIATRIYPSRSNFSQYFDSDGMPLDDPSVRRLWTGCLAAKAKNFTRTCSLLPLRQDFSGSSTYTASLLDYIDQDPTIGLVLFTNYFEPYIEETDLSSKLPANVSIAVFNPEFLHVYAIMRKLADPLARYYFTMPDEEGYMAGVVAGLKSTIGSMLIFSGNADPYGKLHVNAFKNGVYSVCPSCTVQLAYFGSLSDSISVGSYAPSVYYNISKFDVFFNAVPGLLGEAAMIWSGNQNISVIGSTFNIDHNSYSNFTAANLSSSLYWFNTEGKIDVAAYKSIVDNFCNDTYSRNSSSLVQFNLGTAYGAVKINTNSSFGYQSSLFQSLISINTTTTDGCNLPITQTLGQYMSLLQVALGQNAINTGTDSVYGNLNEQTPSNGSTALGSPFGLKPPGLARHSFVAGPNTVGPNGGGIVQFFLFGGMLSNMTATNQFIMLDYVLWTWFSLPTGPPARSDHISWYDSTQNILYVLGGEADGTVLCDLWAFTYNQAFVEYTQLLSIFGGSGQVDSRPGSWLLVNSNALCRTRTSFATSASSGTVYIFGGLDQNWSPSNSIYFMNSSVSAPQLVSVDTSGNFPTAKYYSQMTITPASDYIYVYGGTTGDPKLNSINNPSQNSQDYNSELYSFSIGSNKWTKIQAGGIADPPAFAGGIANAVDDNRILFTGGYNQHGPLKLNFVFNRVSSNWVWQDSSPLSRNITSHQGIFVNLTAGQSCIWDSANFNPGGNYYLCDDLTPTTRIMMYGGLKDDFSVSPDILIYALGEEKQVPNCKIGYYLTFDENLSYECVLCPAGTYNVNGNSTCLECPNGGYCPGGSEVDTIYGWWQNSNSLLNSNTSLRAVSMMRCTGSTCCKSNTSCSIQETCSGNTTGSLCSTCASSEYKLWDNQCVFCKTINGAYMVIFIIIAFAIVLFYALISGGGANVFLPNITFTIQVLGVVNTYQSQNVQSVVTGITKMDFGSGQSVDIVTDKCLAPLDGLGKAYLKLSAPLAIGLAFVIVFILAHFWHKALHNKNQVVCKIHDKFPKRIKNRTMNNFKTAAMQVALFIYLPLINASLSTFACEKVFDQADTSLYTWRMKQYSDVVCWKQDHIILSIVSGVILFVLFIVLPVFGYFVIVKKTAGANMLHALQVPYKQQYAFWALVEFAERILIAIVSVATVSYATYAWAMFVTVLTFLFLQRYNAYKNDEDNWTKHLLCISMVGAAGLAILQKYDCEYSTLKCDIQNMPYANWQIAWLCIPLILFGSRFLRFFYRLFKRYVLKKEDRESVTDPRQSWISPFSKVGNRPSSIQPQNNSQVSPEQNNQTSP